MDNDFSFKFLAIGDSGVGKVKTCLLNQYVEGEYNEKLAPTVGVDIRDKNLEYKSNKTNESFNIHLQLWDTAGQERFRSLSAVFFREAMGFLLVFDLTSESSFINVRSWIVAIQSNAYSENVSMVLVGNKCDLEAERIISKVRAMDFAKQLGVNYIETSALKNVNVTESIKLLLDSVMNHLEKHPSFSQQKSNSVKLLNEQLAKEYLEEDGKPKSNFSYCCSY